MSLRSFLMLSGEHGVRNYELYIDTSCLLLDIGCPLMVLVCSSIFHWHLCPIYTKREADAVWCARKDLPTPCHSFPCATSEFRHTALSTDCEFYFVINPGIKLGRCVPVGLYFGRMTFRCVMRRMH